MLANANVQPITTPGLRWFGRLLTVAFLGAIVVLVFGRYIAFGRQELGSLFRRWGRDAYQAQRYDAAIRNLSAALFIGGNGETRALYNRGLAYQREGNHRAAVEDFSRLVVLTPSDPRPLIAKARSNKALGNRAEIVRDFETAVHANPGNIAALIGLARARADAGDYNGAVGDLDRAALINPEHAGVLALRAQYRLHQDNGSGALEDADRYIQIRPNSADGYALRSLAHTRLGQYDQALIDVDQAIQIGPQTPTLTGRRATLYQKTGKIEDSLPEYQRALDGNANLAWVYRGRGVANWVKQNIDAAEADFSKSVELEPDDFTARLRRARFYVEVDRPDQALLDVNKALQIDPRSARAYITRAAAYARKRDTKRVIADLNRAGALDNESLRTRYERARVYVFTDQYDLAIRDADAILAVKADDVGALKVRGKSHYKLSRYDQALKDFDALVRLQPDDPFVWELRGKTNRQLNNLAEATTDFDRAIELAPENAPAYIERAIVLARLGDVDGALADLETAESLGSLDPRLYVARGNVDYVRALYPSAVDNAAAAISQRPEMLTALMLRARSFARLGNYDLALQDANAAVALRPEDPGTLRLRAKIHGAFKQYDRALADLKLALIKRPDDVQALVDRAHVYMSLGRPGAAMPDLSAALRVQPDHVEALIARAHALYRQNRVADALKDVNSALERSPDRVDALRLRARAYRRLGDVNSALVDLKAADALEPNNADTMVELVRIYERQGDYRNAVRVSASVTDLKGDDRLMLSRAEAYLHIRNFERAQSDFIKVLEAQPENVRALKGLASAQYQQGKLVEARASVDKWLSLDAASLEAKTQRGLIYYREGNIAQAMTDFNEVAVARPDDARALQRLALAQRKSGDTCAAIRSVERVIALDQAVRGSALGDWMVARKAVLKGKTCDNAAFLPQPKVPKPRTVAVRRITPAASQAAAVIILLGPPSAQDLGKNAQVDGVVLRSDPARTGIRLLVKPASGGALVPVLIPLDDYNRVAGASSVAIGSRVTVRGKLTLNTARREVQLRATVISGAEPVSRVVREYALGAMNGNDHNATVRVRGVIENVARVGAVYVVLLRDATGAQVLHVDAAAGIVLEQGGGLQPGQQVEVIGRVDATRGQGIKIIVRVPSDVRRL